MLSRNRRAGETASVGLMVDGGQVGLISTDMDKNLLVTCYKPDLKESAGGKQLVRQCDFNLGADFLSFQILSLFRKSC